MPLPRFHRPTALQDIGAAWQALPVSDHKEICAGMG